MMRKADIVIIGGGIIGCATAYFLSREGRGGNIVVLEADTSYGRATTPQAAGGVRRLFSRPENIRMSCDSLAFYADCAEHLSVDKEPVDIQFRRQGYLFTVTADGAETLSRNAKLQEDEGVTIEVMDTAELKTRFPSIGCDDVALACHSPEDGWIDPYAALRAFRHKAQSRGVRFMEGRVVGLTGDGRRLKHAELENGEEILSDYFINAAGPWASEIAGLIGASLPIVPMCRVQHFWLCDQPIEPLPLVKDETGMFFRPEGKGFAGGCPSRDVEPGWIWDVDRGFFADYFEETVWPLIATRLPKFERIKLQSTWGGHYAQNTLDGNMIIGPFSSDYDNIVTASGFSGHGVMHAPAVGRALAELILDGSYQSIDLTRLGYDRVREDQPYPEIGIT